ncbi:hypothetical protein KW784_01060 [Candidatus Parcubacteria bacterium]|nr:hypothetical protein [Candidatus Parcubacteria bacterium]
MSSQKAYAIVGAGIILFAGYFLFFKDHPGSEKAFVFDNFHGSAAVSPHFSFRYPGNWHHDGQYFSPQSTVPRRLPTSTS